MPTESSLQKVHKLQVLAAALRERERQAAAMQKLGASFAWNLRDGIQNVKPEGARQRVVELHKVIHEAGLRAVTLAIESWRLLCKCADDFNCDQHSEEVVSVIRDAAYAVESDHTTPLAVLNGSWPFGVSLFQRPAEGRRAFVEDIERWAEVMPGDFADSVRPVTMAVIRQHFNVARTTLLRDKRLTDHRPPGHARNAQHMFDPVEVARFYIRKS